MGYEFWQDGWTFGPIGVFGFILAIILINAIASVLKTRAIQRTYQEAIRQGQEIDPAALREMNDDDDSNGSGSVTAGLILMAVGGGLVFMGYQIGKVETDEPVFDIMLGVASIPFLIGVVLFISGLIKGAASRKKD